MATAVQLEFHPIADGWTLLEGEQYEALRESIRSVGLVEPILTYEGKIADGRNRYRACLEEGEAPRFREWPGSEEELHEHLWAVNDARRHDPPKTLKERREQRKQRIDRIAEARANGQSLRSIATSEGVSEAQVRKDLDVATAHGAQLKPSNGKVTGQDGRVRTATPKKHEGSATRDAALERIKRQQSNGQHSNGKPGKPVFDDREVESQIGKLVRTFDARAEVYGKSGAYKDVEKQMALLLASWQRWQIETTGGKKR